MKQVIQYNVYGLSADDAREIAKCLGQLEGCLESGSYGQAAHAHFECPDGVSQEMLPDGCRVVPDTYVETCRRRHG